MVDIAIYSIYLQNQMSHLYSSLHKGEATSQMCYLSTQISQRGIPIYRIRRNDPIGAYIWARWASPCLGVYW